MPRYIDADRFFKNLTGYAAPEMVWDAWDIEHKLGEEPTADVEPVRHGKWELMDRKRTKCSTCGITRDIATQIGWNYCPNCGAKMDLEGVNNVLQQEAPRVAYEGTPRYSERRAQCHFELRRKVANH